MLNHLLERLSSRLSSWLNRVPVDLDFLEFIFSQELVIFSAVTNQLEVPQDIFAALTSVHQMVCIANKKETEVIIVQEKG